MDNPFQQTDHSMFHEKNIEKQTNFDTNMPYQGFLAKEVGNMAQNFPQQGMFGASMFQN
jgi:hypothetical protein